MERRKKIQTSVSGRKISVWRDGRRYKRQCKDRSPAKTWPVRAYPNLIPTQSAAGNQSNGLNIKQSRIRGKKVLSHEVNLFLSKTRTIIYRNQLNACCVN